MKSRVIKRLSSPAIEIGIAVKLASSYIETLEIMEVHNINIS